MKELSIEEKAKRYDEAIEIAKSLYDYNQPISASNVIINNLFPELKESDDEKIRKQIRAFIKSRGSQITHSKTDAWLAYLEKQGEHANFRNKIQIGDKVTRNEDGVLINLSQLNRVAKKDEKQGEQKSVELEEPNFFDDFRHSDCEQKPVEWSEEDEINRDLVYNALNKVYDMEHNKNLSSWLNSLINRVQPKQEWNEEDEEMIDSIIGNIQYLYSLGYCDKATLEMKVDWLKSLRPQKQWRPSEEQIRVVARLRHCLLEDVRGNDVVILDNLLEQLKAL